MFQIFGAYSLFELVNRADVRVLLWLNHFVAARPELYSLALLLTDKGSDVLVLATLVSLWFWPSGEQNRTLFGDADLGGRPSAKVPPLRRWMTNALRQDEYRPVITRVQSRAQVLLFVFGGLSAYVFARLVAFEINVNRPFASFWMVKHPQDMKGVFDDLRAFGSFPSDHAAMLAAFACALFFWSRPLGIFWTVAALVLAVCRVAVGFHYPLDMFGGAVVGLAFVWPLLWIYQQRGGLFRAANVVSRAFDLSNAPYCYLLYFLMLLLGLETASHFKHVLQALFGLRGEIFDSLTH